MEAIQILMDIGFSENESKIYLSLSTLGIASIAEVHNHSKVPRNKVYSSLEKLERKLFVVQVESKPIKYKITDPELLEVKAENISKNVTRLVTETITEKFQSRSIFSFISGRDTLKKKFLKVNLDAKKEILNIASFSRKDFENMRSLDKANKKGVSIRGLTVYNKKYLPVYTLWKQSGVDLRAINIKKFGTNIPRISTIDSSYGRITFAKPDAASDKDYFTLWTESETIISMLKNYFEYIWENSLEI